MKSQEIVTKAVIGKGKKKTKKEYKIELEGIDNVLGCWVINHKFEGYIKNDTIFVNGTYDVNIWYSFDNNTKTNVLLKKIDYLDEMNLSLKDGISKENQVIVRSLSQPSVIDASVDENIVNLTIEKENGVEVIGDTFVHVSVSDEEFAYEEIEDIEDIDEIDENYLN